MHAGVLSPLPSTNVRDWLVSMPNGEVRSITVQHLLHRLYGIQSKNLDLLRLQAAHLLAAGALPQFFEALWPSISFPQDKLVLPAAAEAGTDVDPVLSVDERVVSAGRSGHSSQLVPAPRASMSACSRKPLLQASPRDRMDVVFLRQSTHGVASPPVLEVVEFAVVEPGQDGAPSKRGVESKFEEKKHQLARYHSQLSQLRPSATPS